MAPKWKSKIWMARPRALLPERVPPGKRVESVSPLYRSARGHCTADGRDPGGWPCRLHHTACFRVAGSRLPYHSGADLLSRREPAGDVVGCDGASGATVWPGSRALTNDFDQFRWQFGHRAAV